VLFAGGVLMAPHGKILIPLCGRSPYGSTWKNLDTSLREESLCPTSFHPGTKTKTPMMVLTGVFKISF